MLHPPAHFSYIEKSLCRSLLPKNIDAHIEFLMYIKVEAIFNVSGVELDSSIQEKLGIEASSMVLNSSPKADTVEALEEWVQSAMESLLSLQATSLVWLIGR